MLLAAGRAVRPAEENLLDRTHLVSGAHLVGKPVTEGRPGRVRLPRKVAPGGAVYQGHDGIRKYFADFKDAWGDEFRVEPEAFFDLGEHTLMYYSIHGLGQQSGADVEMLGAQVCRWRDGLMVYGKAYVHREDALRDLGVSEHGLTPIVP
jgi:hypothetical protein